MNHILQSLSIKNFKSVREAIFELSNYTPLVGYNNAGKSNILAAIKWLFTKSSLSEDCFNNKDLPIEVKGIIGGISDEILDLLDPKHKKSIENYISDGQLCIKRLQDKPGLSTTKIQLLVKRIEDDETEWKSNPAGIDNAIAALFPEPISIGTMENSEDDISRSRSTSTIGKLIAEIIGPIEMKYGENVKLALDNFSNLLNADGVDRAEELIAFDTEMNKSINDFFPGIGVKLHIPSPQLKEIFGKGTLKVYEGDSEGRDPSSYGHGTQRSIQMALIRQLAEIKKETNNSPTTTLLLVDEPELYLHPQAVELIREAFKMLSKEGYQIVFSTHTALMIRADDVQDAVLIRKTVEGGTIRKTKLRDIISSNIRDRKSQIETLFDLSNSSNVLFSDKIIVIEGKAELRIFPHAFESITLRSLAAHKYAVVSVCGVDNVKNMMTVVSGMGLDCKSIVDLDYISKVTKFSYVEKDDSDILGCKEKIGILAGKHNFNLSSDGWPCKGGDLLPSEAFRIIGQCPELGLFIESIHRKLLDHNIWLWRKGDFEIHFGINGKDEREWSQYIHNINENGAESTINDYEGVKECIDWLIAK